MRARDKILSMYNENLKDEIDKQRKGLVLSELFAKPRPMWMDPSLIGLFGDAFIEGTRFEGASMLPFAFMSMGLAISRMLETPTLSTTKGSTNGGGSLDILYGLDADDRAKVANVVHVMEASQNIFMMVQRLLKYSNTGQLMWFLRKFRTILRSLGAGQAILVPALVARSEMLIFVMRKPGMHESFFLLFFFIFIFLCFLEVFPFDVSDTSNMCCSVIFFLFLLLSVILFILIIIFSKRRQTDALSLRCDFNQSKGWSETSRRLRLRGWFEN